MPLSAPLRLILCLGAPLFLGGCGVAHFVAIFPFMVADGVVLIGTLGIVNPGLTDTVEGLAEGELRSGLQIGNRENMRTMTGAVTGAVAATVDSSGTSSSSSARSDRYAARQDRLERNNEAREQRAEARERKAEALRQAAEDASRRYAPITHCITTLADLSSNGKVQLRNNCSERLSVSWCYSQSCAGQRAILGQGGNLWNIDAYTTWPPAYDRIYWAVACHLGDSLVDTMCEKPR
jgi:hypothetical protein